MAEHYIKETALPLTEIAFLLGFSELSAFSRAAKQWFGRTPRELRKRGPRLSPKRF
jgi:AraC-like DNA-binding protein